MQPQVPTPYSGARALGFGAIAAAAWIGLWVFALKDTDSATGITGLLALALPLALIALAVFFAFALGTLRQQAQDLRREIGQIQAAQQNAPAAAMAAPSTPAPVPAPPAPVAAPAVVPAPPPVQFSSARAAARPQRAAPAHATSGEVQGTLALKDAPLPPPLQTHDLIRALHFPETADDIEGFRALRRALRDHRAAQIIQAAQDVLTLLSQSGIYMDDLTPDRARPELWRRFAQGERGGAISPLGGVREPELLTTCATRMREDPVFRDAAHHFLRRFDRLLAEIEPELTDQDLADMSDTRTARAFMLVSRSIGLFD